MAVLAPAARAVTCETYPPVPGHNFQAATRGNTTDRINFTQEFGDYGLIFEDAKWRECSGGSWLSQPPYNVKHGAYEALLTKINTTMGPSYNQTHIDFQGQSVLPYQGWLEGGFVTLIFSSALMIGGHGDLDSTLDYALQKVAASYVPTLGGPGKCGFYQQSGWNNGGDTCMEEHVVAASAYAWIAAYESKRRGYWAGRPYAVKANAEIAAAFSTNDSICINDRTQNMDAATRGPCNINIAPSDPNYLNTLRTYLLPDPMNMGRTRGDILSFNRDQNILYGFGQLGQISSALIGLSEGGYNRSSGSGQPSLTAGEQLIAFALMDEAQRKSYSDGSDFRAGQCAKATIVNGAVVRHDAYGCSDTPPMAFAYNTRTSTSGWSSFFEKWVTLYDYQPRASTVDHRVLNGFDYYTTINPAYQFNQFDNAIFDRATDYGLYGALNWGRYSFYKILGWTWNTIDNNRTANNTWVPTAPFDRRPRLWADIDDKDPKGYLDGISSTGVASGWTCDQDKPTTSTFVDFYVDGGGLGTFVLRAQANLGNEPEVTTECNGGSYHRFQVQLPSWTKGRYVYAWGLDATWRGVAVLPGWQCASTSPACVW